MLRLVLLLVLASCAAPRAELATVAVRVHDMDAMVAFYTDAFGFRFEPVDTDGLASMFGSDGELTLKFVPLREAPDFDGFAVHQLGFEVDDVDRVVDAARAHGGESFGEVTVHFDGRIELAVRDPDGNTIEVHGR